MMQTVTGLGNRNTGKKFAIGTVDDFLNCNSENIIKSVYIWHSYQKKLRG